MSAKPRSRMSFRFAKAVIATTLVVASGSFMAGAPPVHAQGHADLAARWVSEARCTSSDCPTAYDFARCGRSWCGIEVRDGKCGRIAFRLEAEEANPVRADFTGRFERSAGTEGYAVRVSVRQPSSFDKQPVSPRLVVIGNTGSAFEGYRRTYALHMVMRREGEALCKGEAKTS